ncbi:MAG: hypothetical protein ACXAC2_08390 [Candidatus Kariarchaeaceae archaeon]|jgi:hypothetical protein
MKISTLSNILLLGSLLLISPLAEQPTEIRIIQQTPISIAVEIHQPQISIKSSVAGEVNYTITYFNAKENTTKKIPVGGTLTTNNRDVTHKVTDIGFYIFDFFSTAIGKITIQGKGIYLASWFYILLFVILRLAIWVRTQYF